MRQFLFAIAVAALLAVSSSPAHGGYIIIRLLLEGAAPGTDPGMGPVGPGPMPSGPGPGFGGRPGLAPPGPGPMGSGPMGPMGPMGAPPGVMDHTRAVVVVVPFEAADFAKVRIDPKGPPDATNPEFKKLATPFYGKQLKTALFVDSATIQLYEDLITKPGQKETRATEMRRRYAAWARGKTDTQALYESLVLALESGMMREPPTKDLANPPDAPKIAQELLEAAAEKKPMPANAERFVKAWAEVSKGLRVAPPQSPEAVKWQSILTDGTQANLRTERFYSIVYWDSSEAEVARRSAQLNDNLTAFYLTHAVRGVALPVPAKPFVVVLAKQGSAYNKLRPALDGLPSQTDAFYSPEHDLLVLSPELMDSVGLTFQKQTQQYFAKGFSREQLLNGQFPKTDVIGVNGPRPEDVARANTLAFVEKLAIDDAEVAAVSREGTRQLLFTTGGLPKHVTLPNWLTQGALNFYTRPRGPAYVSIGEDEKEKAYMTVAFTTGYGVPNYVQQRYFRDLDAHKELNNADRAKLLENVLTDAYFTGLKDAIDPDPAPPTKKKAKPAGGMNPMGGAVGGAGEGPGRPGPLGGLGPVGPMGSGPGAIITGDEEDPLMLQRRKRDRLTIKSQATAWALYYYLARARSGELSAYIAELNKLPRDLPIDGKTSYAAFVKAFKLSATEGGPADPALMQTFARDWLDYIGTVPMVGFDIPLVVPAAVPPGMGSGPMGPMGPGPVGPAGSGGR